MADAPGGKDRAQAIRAKLQELSDKAKASCIRDHPKIKSSNIRIRWVFHDFPKFPFLQESEASPLVKEIPTVDDISQWPAWYLSQCHPVFPDGYVIAEAFVVHCAGGNVPSRHDIDKPTKMNLYFYVKERLKHAIESTIGHDMHQRTVQVNYCVSDPRPPNSFEWVFSPTYPRFPTALSGFERNDLYNCIEALENGNLRVVRVQAAPLDKTAFSDLKRIERIAKKGVKALVAEAERRMVKVIKDATGSKEAVEDLPEAMEQTSVITEQWEWKFTEDYPQFYIAKRGSDKKKRRNRLVDWPSQPLRDVIHAMNMGYLTLSPRLNLRSPNTPLKPRRADVRLPSTQRVLERFSQGTDDSDVEDDQGSLFDQCLRQDTPDTYSGSRSPIPDDTIHVEPGPAITLSGSSTLPARDILRGNTKLKHSTTQKCIQSLIERISGVVKDEAEIITHALKWDAEERSRLQQIVEQQRKEMTQKDKEISNQTTTITCQRETIQCLDHFIDLTSRRLDALDVEGNRKVLEDLDHHEAQSNQAFSIQTRLPIVASEKHGGDSESDQKLRFLISRFESLIDEVIRENTIKDTIIAALVEQQTRLKQDLEEKTKECKGMKQIDRQEMDNSAGKDLQDTQGDTVNRVVKGSPSFNHDRKGDERGNQPQRVRGPELLQRKAPSKIYAASRTSITPVVHRFDQRSDISMDERKEKSQKSQVRTTPKGPSSLQASKTAMENRIGPLATTRNSFSAFNNNGQGVRVGDHQVSQKRKDAHVVPESNTPKRIKPTPSGSEVPPPLIS